MWVAPCSWRIIGGQNGAARIAEHVLHAFPFQTLPKNAGPGHCRLVLVHSRRSLLLRDFLIGVFLTAVFLNRGFLIRHTISLPVRDPNAIRIRGTHVWGRGSAPCSEAIPRTTRS